MLDLTMLTVDADTISIHSPSSSPDRSPGGWEMHTSRSWARSSSQAFVSFGSISTRLMFGMEGGLDLSRLSGISKRSEIHMGRWSEMDCHMGAWLMPASVTMQAVWVVRM